MENSEFQYPRSGLTSLKTQNHNQNQKKCLLIAVYNRKCYAKCNASIRDP